MRNFSAEFRRILISGNHNYLVKLEFGTYIIRETDIMQNGFEISTASSGNTKFELGATVIGQCKVILNNIDEKFSNEDFNRREFKAYIGLEGDTLFGEQRWYSMGVFTVDEYKENGLMIEIIALDRMALFDSPVLIWENVSMTCKEIVESLCASAGITLATPTFPNSHKRIPKSVMRYVETAQTDREILHWVAELCGCFCVMDGDGELCLKSYNKNLIYTETSLDGGTFSTKGIPYGDGDSADGGNFADYSSGDSYDFGGFNDAEQMGIVHFGSNNSVSFDRETIEVTGIEITTTKNKVFLYGNKGYVIKIQKNPFIQNINCDDIGNTLADMYVGLRLKEFKLDTLSDARVEVGDTCTAINVRGKYEMSIITNLTFSIGNSMSVSCNCESIKENSETRYSETKTNAELVDSIQTTVDTTLQEQITSSEGMFYDRETIDNKIEEVSLEIPNLQASTVDIGEGAVLESGTFYFVYE